MPAAGEQQRWWPISGEAPPTAANRRQGCEIRNWKCFLRHCHPFQFRGLSAPPTALHLGTLPPVSVRHCHASLSGETFQPRIPDELGLHSQYSPGESQPGPEGLAFLVLLGELQAIHCAPATWSPGSISTAGEGSSAVMAHWGTLGCHSTLDRADTPSGRLCYCCCY